jgi:uncharacterized RDD family membrane protein YckC
MDDILDEKTYETRAVEFASFSLRTTTFMTDVLIFGAFSFGLNYAFELQSSYLIFLKVYWWEIIILLTAYFIYFDGSEDNATLGKQIMNIRMLNEDKRSIEFTDSVKHFFLSLLLFPGYFRMLSNEKKQTLADKICKVIVVKVR